MSGIDYSNPQVIKADLKRLEAIIPLSSTISWVNAVKNVDQAVDAVEAPIQWNAFFNLPDPTGRWTNVGTTGLRYLGTKTPAVIMVDVTVNMKKTGTNSFNAVRLNIDGVVFQNTSQTLHTDKTEGHTLHIQKIITINPSQVLSITVQNSLGANTSIAAPERVPAVTGPLGYHANLNVVELNT